MEFRLGQLFVRLARVETVQHLRPSVGQQGTIGDTVVACRYGKNSFSSGTVVFCLCCPLACAVRA